MTYQDRLEDYDPNDIDSSDMNPGDMNPGDMMYDRLVDGELSREEYRQFLASLDEEPGGWRRCALAFLEAQALRQDIADLVPKPSEVPARHNISDSSHCVTRAMNTRDTRLKPILAVAVSFLIAFGLGISIRGWWPASDAFAPHGAQIVGRQQESLQFLSQREVPDTSPTPINPPLPRTVRVVMGGEQLDLPVDVAKWHEDNWLNHPQSVMPDRIIGAFQRMGHDVHRRHHYFPFDLQNGRQLVVPIEEVEIVPVSRRSFQ